MNNAKKKYKQACKVKVITFYKCDADLLEYANSINFQKGVKNWLRLCMTFEKLNKDANEEIQKRLNERYMKP